MNKIPDAEFAAFLARNNCNFIRSYRNQSERGGLVTYIEFTCKCGQHATKKWTRFKQNPMCAACSRLKGLKGDLTEDAIRLKLAESGLEYISFEKKKIGSRNRILVNFICICDAKTSRKIKQLYWDVLQTGALCAECGNARRKYSVAKAYNERKKEIMLLTQKTCLKKYGTEHPMQNTEIQNKASKRAYKSKDYTFPSGRLVRVQGYESFALGMLLSIGVSEEEIYAQDDIAKCELIEEFWYEFKGQNCRYFPDIFDWQNERFIEVKSEWTLVKNMDKTQAKIQCIQRAGYDIEVWIFNDKGSLLRIEKYTKK
jgi:hypothetical protein